jgi:hypothetical protein
MAVYRAPMPSRRDHPDPAPTLTRALELGLVGMGGVLPSAPATLAEALAELSVAYDERLARRVERFAAVPDGEVVWTRDPEARYRRGTIVGPWRYDDDPAAVDVDLVHVRDARWDDEGLEEHEAPAAVVASFGRGGRNFQRIRAAGE